MVFHIPMYAKTVFYQTLQTTDKIIGVKMIRYNSKQKAFTLAETMITLVMIGVLAAMVIPTIIGSAPKQNKVMFKKAYASLEEAVYNMINDETNYPSSSLSGTTLRGFNNTSATTNGTVNKFCYFLADQMNTIGTPYCPARGGNALAGCSAGQWGYFTTTDGIYWRLYFRNSDDDPNAQSPMDNRINSSQVTDIAQYPILIFIDVNGSKSPNCTAGTMFGSNTLLWTQCASTADCSSNPDEFVVAVRYDGKLIPGAFHGVSYPDVCENSILSDPTNNR